MTRLILCPACGEARKQPIHPEDAAAGYQKRVLDIVARRPPNHAITFITDGVSETEPLPSLMCDGCGAAIIDGSLAVAVTMWRPDREDALDWENEYSQ